MKKLPIFLFALIALGIGFAVHAGSHSAKANSAQDASTEFATPSSRNQSHLKQRNHIHALSKGITSTGGNEAWFRWLAYLENANLSDLPNYVEQAGNDPIALSLVAERWVALNPEDCFEYLLTLRESGDFSHDDSAGNLFSKLVITKWVQRNLEGAITALDHSEALAGLNNLRKLTVDLLLANDPERALALGSRWKSFHASQNMPSELAEWAQRNPQAAASAIFQISASSSATADSPGPFLPELAKIWAQKNPQAALEFGITQGNFRGYRFANLVFSKWADQDLDSASQWLSKVSDEQAAYFTPTFMNLWARVDPSAALDWSQESLSGRLLSQSIQQIMKAAATSKDVNPRDLLARIESPEVHHKAVIALANKLWNRTHWHGLTGNSQNIEEISWFDDVTDPRTLDEIFINLSSAWSQADFEGYKTFLVSPRALGVSPSRFGVAIYALAGKAPQQTMDFVGGLPERLIPDASASAFSIWHGRSPDEAVAWAQELATNDPRRAHLIENMREAFTKPHQESVANLNSMPLIMKELYRADIAALIEKGSGMMDRNGAKVDFRKLLRDTAE